MFTDWLAFFWNQIENINAIQPGIFNIPWLFVSLQPLRIIGKYPALILVQIASLYIIFRIGQDLKLSKPRMVMVFLSAPVFWNFFMGQIDGIILSAYLLPPNLAVLLAVFKPQTALWAGYDGIRKRPFLILMAAMLVISAFLIWRWPFSATSPVSFIDTSFTLSALIPPIFNLPGWNWGIWPWGLLLIPLFFLKDKATGMLVSPFIFPYAGLHSLIGPILGLAAKAPAWLFTLVWLLLWIRWGFMTNVWP